VARPPAAPYRGSHARGELYQAAADLVREVVAGGARVEPHCEHRLPLAGTDEADRFFRFVRELLFLHDVEGFLPLQVDLNGEARVVGEIFDPRRHARERAVKALTRHGYRFEWTPAGVHAELLLDL
jgi:SHS2 domain-containing protein